MMNSCHNNNVEDEPTVGCNCCMTEHPHLDKFFASIAKESTAHGVKYIASRKLHPFERVFWTIVMLTSFGYSIYLVQNVYSKYEDSPVIISFQPNETTISNIPFPAITICNVNMLKTSVLSKKFEQVWQQNKDLDFMKKNDSHDPAILSALRRQVVEGVVHLDHLAQFCLSAMSFRRRLNVTLKDAEGRDDFIQWITNQIQVLDKNVSEEMRQAETNNSHFALEERELFKNATFSCEEMLLECMWADERIPCKEIFFHIETRNGRCCTYNMMPKFLLQTISEDEHRAKREMRSMPQETLDDWKSFADDDHLMINDVEKLTTRNYPKHQKAGGKPYGLTVLANPSLHEYSTCTVNDGLGFKMVAHSPLSFPSIMDYGAAIPPGSEVFVDIEPQVTVADLKLLQGINIKKRGCYLPSDPEANLKYYNYYSTENCLSECLAHHAYLNCSCVWFFMPRNATQKLCGAKDRECIDGVRVNLTKTSGKNSFCHNCLPPCSEILYKLQLSHFDIKQDNVSSYFTYKNSTGHSQNATNYSIIHIYMGTDSLYAMERKTLYQWFDLVANAGGLLSLTMGVSIMSFIEVGYYFTIRAWFQFRSVSKNKDKTRDVIIVNGVHSKLKKRGSVGTKTEKDADDEYYWAVRNRFNRGAGGGDPHVVLKGKK